MRIDPTPGGTPQPGGGTPMPGSPAWGVHVGRVPPEGSRESHAVAARCARALEIPLHETRLLLATAPVLLPRAFPEHEAHQFAAGLERDGAAARVKRHPHAGTAPCNEHPSLLNDGSCTSCAAWICAACRALAEGEARCPRCRQRTARGRLFRRLRIAVLAGVLVGVAWWAWDTHQRRAERTTWTRTLQVAVFLLASDSLDPGDADAVARRLPVLADTLTTEARRYRGEAAVIPFEFRSFGPISVAAPPPAPAPEAHLVDRARHAFDLWRVLDRIHGQVDADPGDFDARIYVTLRAGDGQTVYSEGHAEAGGEVGLVQAAIGADEVDGALVATAHELLHLLGAHDKYDADGHALVPEGLAEPALEPLFPQRYGEVMAGEVATGASAGRLIERLDELRVGPATAAEIRWVTP